MPLARAGKEGGGMGVCVLMSLYISAGYSFWRRREERLG